VLPELKENTTHQLIQPKSHIHLKNQRETHDETKSNWHRYRMEPLEPIETMGILNIEV